MQASNDDKVAGVDDECHVTDARAETYAAGDENDANKRHHNDDILDKWVVVMDENFYVPPVEVEPGDTSAMSHLDTNKLIELREVKRAYALL